MASLFCYHLHAATNGKCCYEPNRFVFDPNRFMLLCFLFEPNLYVTLSHTVTMLLRFTLAIYAPELMVRIDCWDCFVRIKGKGIP